MELFKEIKRRKYGENGIHRIELTYSWFMFLSGNPRWFCRIYRWKTGSTLLHVVFSESYGHTKFEAYRKAINDFNRVSARIYLTTQK